jgi:hypothetical protein
MLTVMGYIPRPAIEIAGTRWCGKTWCALMHAKSASHADENLAGAGPVMLRVVTDWGIKESNKPVKHTPIL